MTKSIAISSLVLGIVIFAASINFITSSTHPSKPVVLDEITVVGSVPSKSTSVEVLYNPAPIKKHVKASKVSNKRTGMTISYNHTLEQGGSPMNRTVRVIENL